MILTLIVACELAFWVLVAGGLALRYPGRRPRLGAVVLLLVPVVDAVLLVATAIHLRGGGVPDLSHAIAACYLGFTLVYGHRAIRWLDARFAYRFAGAAAPRALTGAPYARHCWADVLRSALAMGIASAAAWLLAALATPGADVSALHAVYGWSAFPIVVEVLWASSYTVWPKKARGEAAGQGSAGDAQPEPMVVESGQRGLAS